MQGKMRKSRMIDAILGGDHLKNGYYRDRYYSKAKRKSKEFVEMVYETLVTGRMTLDSAREELLG